jgi:16S rRNA processing protein RimM
VGRAHGIRGEVRVVPSTDNPERFRPGSRLYARMAGGAPSGDPHRRLEIAGVRGDAAQPIVAFRDVATRVEAEVLRQAILEVPGSDLPDLEEGEFYPYQLAGLEVRDQGGRVRGEVVGLLDAPANDVLDLRLNDGRRHLVPFVEPAVPTVDLAGGFLVVEDAFFLEPEDAGS